MDLITILGWNLDTLKEKCEEFQLDTHGRKQDLQERMILFFQNQRQNENDTVEVQNENDTVEVQNENGTVEAVENQNETERVEIVENQNGNETVEVNRQIVKPTAEENEEFVQSYSGRSHFTLRDVQDSLSFFSGTGRPSVRLWLDEFEDSAKAVQWDDLQKFIYAKQLLKGAAQLFVRSQTNIYSWLKLRSALLDEFGGNLSTAETHKLLAQQKKHYKETYLEFLYKIMEISKAVKLDDESIIDYFIEGIPDSRINKSMLYEAKTIAELKSKIKVYERTKSNSNDYFAQKKTERPLMQKSLNFRPGQVKICSKCPHLRNHSTEECLKLNGGCFKCGLKGHRASDCRKNDSRNIQQDSSNKNKTVKFNNQPNDFSVEKPSTSQNSKRSMQVISTMKSCKIASIENVEFVALIDTGSDLTLLKKSIFDQIPGHILIPGEVKLNGVGQGVAHTLGYTVLKISIDNISFNWSFHIIDNDVCSAECLLGNDILEIVDIYFSNNGPTLILKEEPETTEVCLFRELLGRGTERYNETFTAGKVFHQLCIDRTIEPSDILENTGNISKSIQLQLLQMIRTYKPEKTENSDMKMKIVLKNEEPICQRPRRLPFEHQKIVEKQISEWLEQGIIEESRSEFAAPIVLVSKKDGSKRLCCDYRKINEQIVKDNFPMILIDEVLAKLQKAKVYSTFDLKNGFFHVNMDEDSQKYTAFITHHGQFQFKVAPFGMKNSPAAFCRFIAYIFHDLIQNGTIVVYMDDIVIPSINEEENLKSISEVLKIASKYGLEINWKKCQFIKTEINFLGYVVKNSTIKPSPEKIKAVVNYKVPSDIKSLQRFIGLTSYFRRFIDQFASLAKPLTDLLTKNTKFKMDNEQLLAFEALKQALISEPILKLFNPEAITEVHTDASSFGYGATLMQKDSEDQLFHPVEYMSRKTTPTEQKYSAYELEVLAVIKALTKWRVYLLGIEFKLITDCHAFTQTIKKTEVPAKIARYIIFLQDFSFTVEHRAGSKLKHVDALSRVYTLMIESSLRHSIIRAQDKDDFIGLVKTILQTRDYKDFYVRNQILYKDKEQVVIPQSMEGQIIEVAHKQGHFAARKTQEIIEKDFYIKDVKKKVEDYVKNCVECILANQKAGKKEGLLNPIDKSDRPLETFHLDHVGPLEATKKQYNYLLVIIDAFSKFVWLYPTKSTGTEEVINILQKQAEVFGNPQRIITDRGAAFTSNAFNEYCAHSGVQHHLITTGVPRGNGQVERTHKTVLNILTKLCLENPKVWYKHVGRVQQFINSTPTRSTKFSPFTILTGNKMKLPQNFDLNNLLEKELIEEINKERDEIRIAARDNITKIQEENRKYYDKNRKKEYEYEIGDLVAIKRTQFGSGLKLKPNYLGPYKITAKRTKGRYAVEKLGETEGPNKTLTTAEFMKKWHDSGTNHTQDGRM